MQINIYISYINLEWIGDYGDSGTPKINNCGLSLSSLVKRHFAVYSFPDTPKIIQNSHLKRRICWALQQTDGAPVKVQGKNPSCRDLSHLLIKKGMSCW